MKINVPVIIQDKDSKNCAPCTLKSILDYYKIENSLDTLIKQCSPNKRGTSPEKTIKCGLEYGLFFIPIPLDNHKDFDDAVETALQSKWPVMISLETAKGNHLCVIKGFDERFYYFSDPFAGEHKRTRGETWFLAQNRYANAVLLLE